MPSNWKEFGMKRGSAFFALLCLVACGVRAGEADRPKLVVGEFTLTLPEGWKLTQAKPETPGVVAVRYVDKAGVQVVVGELMAAELSGSVAKESKEMETSAKQEVVKLTETGGFETRTGLEGRQVLLTVAVADRDFGNPFVLYSLYLPQTDGTCVTLKLRCGASRFTSLRGEFEEIVAGAQTNQPAPQQ
jgi:hypothetical protein